MKVIISTTEHNEVNPLELSKLFALGAKLISNNNDAEEKIFIGEFTDIDGERVKAYSTDIIAVKGVGLRLSRYANYNSTIELNI